MTLELETDWEKRDENTPISVHIIAGCCAGLVEHVSMLPFDNIKTRFQVYNDQHMKQVIRDMMKQGGFRSFFTGISAATAGCMPAHALQFSVYEYLKKFFQVNDEEHHPFIFAFIGASATLFHDLFMTPFDVIKQRTQINVNLTSSQVYRKLMQTEGRFSLFRSFPITYFTSAPNQAIVFSANETLKLLLANKNEHNAFTYSLCGGIAGGLATFFTTPFDVIKTKLQTQQCHISDELKLKQLIKYENISSTVTIIMKEYGIRGFFKGLTPRFFMQAPSSAVAWGTYETVKKFLLSQGSQH